MCLAVGEASLGVEAPLAEGSEVGLSRDYKYHLYGLKMSAEEKIASQLRC
jgi:hypothetical protein